MTDRLERRTVTFRLDPALLLRVDTCARAGGITRPEAFRAALLKWAEAAEQVEARRRRLAADKRGGAA